MMEVELLQQDFRAILFAAVSSRFAAAAAAV